MTTNALHGLVLGLLAGATLFLSACSTVPRVVIDAGHGGRDSGAVNRRAHVVEKNATLQVAKALDRKLRSKGIPTLLTRSDDRFVSLAERCAIANSHRDAVFVSIHFNSCGNSRTSGVETYYYTPGSQRLAQAIGQQVAAFQGQPNRGAKWHQFYVIHHNERPAILVECGFLSNYVEAQRISQAEYQSNLADAIARGLYSAR